MTFRGKIRPGVLSGIAPNGVVAVPAVVPAAAAALSGGPALLGLVAFAPPLVFASAVAGGTNGLSPPPGTSGLVKPGKTGAVRSVGCAGDGAAAALTSPIAAPRDANSADRSFVGGGGGGASADGAVYGAAIAVCAGGGAGRASGNGGGTEAARYAASAEGEAIHDRSFVAASILTVLNVGMERYAKPHSTFAGT